MKVYVVVHEDRHSDPEVTVFADKDAAIEYARATAKEFDRFGDYKERPVKGWLFNVKYSCESDGLFVVEKEIRGTDLLSQVEPTGEK